MHAWRLRRPGSASPRQGDDIWAARLKGMRTRSLCRRRGGGTGSPMACSSRRRGTCHHHFRWSSKPPSRRRRGGRLPEALAGGNVTPSAPITLRASMRSGARRIRRRRTALRDAHRRPRRRGRRNMRAARAYVVAMPSPSESDGAPDDGSSRYPRRWKSAKVRTRKRRPSRRHDVAASRRVGEAAAIPGAARRDRRTDRRR
mmetsp:Transcript_4806/g.17178  ORF Transcript_4806/g.17178 Transcript_4806/m.17178 type:complete len:201 (+) Transcript_4806:68-670(+)